MSTCTFVGQAVVFSRKHLPAAEKRDKVKLNTVIPTLYFNNKGSLDAYTKVLTKIIIGCGSTMKI